MAKIVIIYDEGGIVGFQRRDTPLRDLGTGSKKVLDIVRNVDLSISQYDLANEYGQLGAIIREAEVSERLSEEEKAAFRRLLLTYDFVTDSLQREYREGEFDRTHGGAHASDNGSGPPPGDTVRTRIVDP